MLLALEDVRKSYATGEGPLEVLRGVSLELAAGESVALTGESGSGKSTLLHLAGGLDRPDGGAILFEGRDIAGLGEGDLAAFRRRRVGLVFQQFNLIPSLDVAANLAFQARLAGVHDAGWCRALAERLGLSKHLTRYP
jgi:putative ABC transport system ATP-binding protein